VNGVVLPACTPLEALARAHGEPLGSGRLRVEPEDFQVEEDLGFEPDGEGPHRLLWVRKRDANTEWVARRLAALAGVAASEVGFAGLKDRHALTWQWFSLPAPRPGAPEPQWSALVEEGIEVLSVQGHGRKLRRGVLRGNRFRLRVRDCRIDPAALDSRLEAMRARGVPNYFGEQRFGRQGANLARAQALFAGAIRRAPRHQRGLWLSAARSQLFNEVLAERVRGASWDRPLPGERLQLAGSQSHFLAETLDASLIERVACFDLHPSGPLWGAGESPVAGEVDALESAVLAPFGDWTAGLARAGLKQERRALRLALPDLQAELRGSDLHLDFSLPAGAYATVVLRELLHL